MKKDSKKYLVDTCSGSKYYSKYANAIEAYYQNPNAHTFAIKVRNKWIPINKLKTTTIWDGEQQQQ